MSQKDLSQSRAAAVFPLRRTRSLPASTFRIARSSWASVLNRDFKSLLQRGAVHPGSAPPSVAQIQRMATKWRACSRWPGSDGPSHRQRGHEGRRGPEDGDAGPVRSCSIPDGIVNQAYQNLVRADWVASGSDLAGSPPR
jgi:hypothetical protein